MKSIRFAAILLLLLFSGAFGTSADAPFTAVCSADECNCDPNYQSCDPKLCPDLYKDCYDCDASWSSWLWCANKWVLTWEWGWPNCKTNVLR